MPRATRRRLSLVGAAAVIDERSRAEAVVATLDDVIDPELGIGILSLGLIYKVGVSGDDVEILMTLTVPGCPMHATITRDVQVRIGKLDWVRNVDVQLTFDPPWTVERLSDDARRRLGRT